MNTSPKKGRKYIFYLNIDNSSRLHQITNQVLYNITLKKYLKQYLYLSYIYNNIRTEEINILLYCFLSFLR